MNPKSVVLIAFLFSGMGVVQLFRRFNSGNQGRCICNLIYKPVCGNDERTYANLCQAACATVVRKQRAERAPPRIKLFLDPANATASFNLQPIVCQGRCPCEEQLDDLSENVALRAALDSLRFPVASCVCSRDYDPVCGSDGRTYINTCRAECQNAKVECKEKCPCSKTCGCPEEEHDQGSGH